MNEELFLRVAGYKAVMAMVKTMLNQGLISDSEYTEIDTIIAKKYRLDSSVIYR